MIGAIVNIPSPTESPHLNKQLERQVVCGPTFLLFMAIFVWGLLDFWGRLDFWGHLEFLGCDNMTMLVDWDSQTAAHQLSTSSRVDNISAVPVSYVSTFLSWKIPLRWRRRKKRKMIYAPRNEFCMIWVIFLMPTDHVMAFLCFISDNQMVGMSGQVGEVWGGQFLVNNKFVLDLASKKFSASITKSKKCSLLASFSSTLSNHFRFLCFFCKWWHSE